MDFKAGATVFRSLTGIATTAFLEGCPRAHLSSRREMEK